jgi:hypothetical protein
MNNTTPLSHKTLPIITFPIYTVLLPVSNNEITYRPFTMKEEKILMLASETGDDEHMTLTLKEIVKNCVIKSTIPINYDNIPVFELQYLFLQLRMKSVGEIATLEFKCTKCETMNRQTINIADIKITQNPNHIKRIELTDTIGLIMKYPNLTIMNKISEMNDIDSLFEVIINCIEYVYDGDRVINTDSVPKEELKEFVESMTEKNFQAIQVFFETLPKLDHSIKFKCFKCGEENNYLIEGIGNFF